MNNKLDIRKKGCKSGSWIVVKISSKQEQSILLLMILMIKEFSVRQVSAIWSVQIYGKRE